MKKMKTLSLLFLAVIMSSTGLMSCINDDVDPVVESIYRNQALLLAAQAALLDAEANYQDARAAAENAYAAETAALTVIAQNQAAADINDQEEALRLLMAQNDALVVEAGIALEKAQLKWEIRMDELEADIAQAKVALADEYWVDFRSTKRAIAQVEERKVRAEARLLDYQLYAESGGTSLAFQAAKLAEDLAKLEADLEADIMTVAELEAAMADPSTNLGRSAELEALKAANVEEQAAILIEIAELEATYAPLMAQVDEWNDAHGDFWAARDAKDFAQSALEDLEADLVNSEMELTMYMDLLGDYDATVLAAEEAVTAAQADVDEAELLLGTDVSFDGYYTEDADGNAIAVDGAKYAAPANLQEVLVNANIDKLNAQDAYDLYEIAYGLLVQTYNDAAQALAMAQDTDAEEAALAGAQDDETIAQDAYDLALQAYDDAAAIFGGAPDGADVEDGAKQDPATNVDDLGAMGIVGDGEATTYREVTAWLKIPGEAVFTPSALGPNLTEAQVLADIDAKLVAIGLDPAIPGGAVGGEYNMTARSDFYTWNQAGGRAQFDGGGVLVPVVVPATFGATDPEVVSLVSILTEEDIEAIIYLEVEADDTSVSNLYTLNVTTNMLGQEDFSDRAFTEAALVAGMNSASYDTMPIIDGPPNTNPGEANGGPWALTAEAVLWNAKKAVYDAQEALDTANGGLQVAQEDFNFQQDLFDNGVANLALLQSDVDTADTAQGEAEGDVDVAWVALGQAFAEGMKGDTKREVGDAVPTDSLTLNEVLYNAQITLADIPTEDMVAEEIITKEYAVANYKALIGLATVAVTEFTAAFEEAKAIIDAGGDDSEGVIAALAVIYNEIDDLEAISDGLGVMNTAYDIVISALSADVAAQKLIYDNAVAAVEAAPKKIDKKMVEIAEGEVDLANLEADIEFTQNRLESIDELITSLELVAAEYYRLMEEALQS